MNAVIGVLDAYLPQLMSIADRSPLNLWMRAMTAPRKPSVAHAPGVSPGGGLYQKAMRGSA